MIELSDMIENLTEDVPARNGSPTDSQYERSVLEAVRDFGNRCGRIKIDTLSVVAGTASYALQADFLRMIHLDSMHSHGGILNTSSGLIPINTGFRERFTISNRQISFDPTPTYTLERKYEYKAGWALTEVGEDYADSTYEDMTEEESRIILLKAAALALKYQANAVALDGWRYSIGDESVDKTGQVDAIEKRIESANAEYLAAVDSYNGSAGGLDNA